MLIVHVITDLYQGGAESALCRLVTAPVSDVRHVVVSMIDEGVHGERLRASNIALELLRMPRGRLTLGGLIQLYRLLRRLKPDVVQTWMYHGDLVGGIVARLAGFRAVVWGIRHSDFDWDKTRWSTRWTVKAGAALSGMVPCAIACNSERAAKVHQAFGYEGSKFRVIANGYDLSQFRPDVSAGLQLREHWGAPTDVPLVGCVARWHPQKDHASLLQALARVVRIFPDVKCVLAGQEMGGKNAALISMIESLGLEGCVRLIGPRDDVEAIMNALDLHVMSSAFGEAFPNTVAEAMASETPCVVTDVGDAAWIVGDTGWVVRPKESAALADAITTALRERRDLPQQWRARQTAARERIADNFRVEKMTSSYRALWTEVIRSTRGGRAGQDAITR